ncbi:MAG: hypothetical protein GY807_02185 [Gammaproteobacteria bacterium]|nr:hypothetical protein [Gammaproteobacteria bacterium]
MKTLRIVFTVLAGAMTIATTPVRACDTSTWTKTSGNSFADKIKGRDCAGTMSVRMMGGFGDTGWMPMYKNGTSNFKAQYGDGKVLTDINMKTNGATMSAIFVHRADGGQISTTQGTYLLTGS